MAIHSSTIAWKIPWTEEPGRLPSMGSQRVGHDWATSLSQMQKDELIISLTAQHHVVIASSLSCLFNLVCHCSLLSCLELLHRQLFNVPHRFLSLYIFLETWISLFFAFWFSIYFVMIPLFKNSESWDILASPMGIRFCACSIRGLGSIPWSGNRIPQATTKDPGCCK